MSNVERRAAALSTSSILHAARFYDLMAWAILRGRLRDFRSKVADLAALQPGESVLDVGCGTGTLAIAAKRRVGAAGNVCGVDASAEMVARSRRKARRARTEVDFRIALIEALPFQDGQFDAVLSTLMLHHLPRRVRKQGVGEISRVLKPEGRLLVVDFRSSAQQKSGFFAGLHRRHGHVKLDEIVALLEGAGLRVIQSGSVGVSDLHFVLAAVPPYQP